MLFEATLQQGLEGIVSKRLTSRYSFGERSKSWLKFAHRHRRSYVVGGWRPQEGTTDRLAALLVGELTPEGLLYRGRVGSGIGGTASRSLTAAGRAARARRQPVRRRGAARGRPRAPSGWSRCWSSTWRPTAWATTGSGSRRTAASATTSRPTTWRTQSADAAREAREDRGPGRRRGPHHDALEPGEGALPAHRHHQGRGAQLLRADRAGDAAAPRRPGGDPDPVAARHRGHELLREEHPERHAVVGAHRQGADDRVADRLASRTGCWSSRSSTTSRR